MAVLWRQLNWIAVARASKEVAKLVRWLEAECVCMSAGGGMFQNGLAAMSGRCSINCVVLLIFFAAFCCGVVFYFLIQNDVRLFRRSN